VPVQSHPQKARLSPAKVALTLKGPLLDLKDLKPEDLKTVVDTGNLTPGRHKLNVSVNLPPSITLVKIQPPAIEARIEKSP
jgi:YbbR domain-containing protein